MGLIVHGIGLMTYGQRDFWPDGSFVTTEWFVLAWVPLIPICSKRVSYTRGSDYATYDANGGFYVYETMAIDRRQALFTYVWLVCVLGPIIVCTTLFSDLGDEDRAAAVCLGTSAVALVFPYFLRRWVKRRKIEEWKRQALGLHG
jgi:hypothetical protein